MNSGSNDTNTDASDIREEADWKYVNQALQKNAPSRSRATHQGYSKQPLRRSQNRRKVRSGQNRLFRETSGGRFQNHFQPIRPMWRSHRETGKRTQQARVGKMPAGASGQKVRRAPSAFYKGEASNIF